MKKSLLKITAPALAIGLAFSVQGGALAHSPNASAQGKANANSEVKVNHVPSQIKVVKIDKRLAPVEKRLASVNSELSQIVTILSTKESLTLEEFSYYEDRIKGLNNRLKASTNQLNAVSKKLGSGSSAVVEVKLGISGSKGAITEAQTLLKSIPIVAAPPETEVPIETDVPAESPVTP
ncbi:hypothetical protein [Planococcus shixiaomingii]|uniref:hypothetical protein n=1 Tax=Planococcus shixiaomingii TaxID=3058393 RepID=UPI0026078715|nr:hypothetical protein [Planococcus sp. N022]WKA56460.1 hypothetical protein QWY21_08970 [Planococcus sp. N022]